MKVEEIRKLAVGTRIRGKFGEGTIVFSERYGKGVKFDGYPYSFPEDMHGFDQCEDITIEQLVTELVNKTYSPHIIVVWTSPTTVAVKEYSFQEDAEEKYRELVEAHAQKVVLAKVVKGHGEG